MGKNRADSQSRTHEALMEQLEPRLLLSAAVANPGLPPAGGSAMAMLMSANPGPPAAPAVGAMKIVSIDSRLDVVITYLGQVTGLGGVLDEYQVDLAARRATDMVMAVDIDFTGSAYQVGVNTPTLAAARQLLADPDMDSHLLLNPANLLNVYSPAENNDASMGVNADGEQEGYGSMLKVIAAIGRSDWAMTLPLAHIVVPQGQMVYLTGAAANGSGTGFYFSRAGESGIPILVEQQDPVAPVVSATTAPLAFTEGDRPKAVDPGLTIADADSLNLTVATVWISGNYAAGQDVLGFANQAGISGSWNAATGTLTLSGAASLAGYQAALRSVTYSNGVPYPSTAVRAVSFMVNDGLADSNIATRTINVMAGKHAPTVSAIAKNVNKNTVLAFSAGDFAAAFRDGDAGDSLQKVKITSLPSHGTLKLSGVKVKLNQEIAAAQLGGLTYTPASNYVGADSFGWNGSDGTMYAAGAAAVSLSVTYHVPTVRGIAKAVAKNGMLTFSAGDFTAAFSDPDASHSLQKVKITSLPGRGTLKLSGVNVRANQEIAVSQLGGLTYTPSRNYAGSDSFGWNGSDGTVYAASAATVSLTVR